MKDGYCPSLSDSISDGTTVQIMIRGECKNFYPVGGYIVDLSTGKLVSYTDFTPIDTEELAAVRSDLFARRAASRVSRGEALCLLHHLGGPAVSAGACHQSWEVTEDDNWFEAADANHCGVLWKTGTDGKTRNP